MMGKIDSGPTWAKRHLSIVSQSLGGALSTRLFYHSLQVKGSALSLFSNEAVPQKKYTRRKRSTVLQFNARELRHKFFFAPKLLV